MLLRMLLPVQPVAARSNIRGPALFTVQERDPGAVLLVGPVAKRVLSVVHFDPAVSGQSPQCLPDRPGSPLEAFPERLELRSRPDQPTPPSRILDT